VLYLYNPDETDETSFSYLDHKAFYNRLFGLYLVAFVTLIGMNATVAGIKADWVVQNELYQLANGSADDEEQAEEPAAEEPAAEEAAPADEFFF